MQNNKIMIWAVVAIVAGALLAIGGYLMFLQNQQTPSNTQNNQPTENDTQIKSFTLSDVERHNTATDCWMAINGKVYDVTEFIGTHPGGPAIIGGCGKDATTLFTQRPTNEMGPHPEQAIALLATFYIGDFK